VPVGQAEPEETGKGFADHPDAKTRMETNPRIVGDGRKDARHVERAPGNGRRQVEREPTPRWSFEAGCETGTSSSWKDARGGSAFNE